jgi:hypothetical protein
VKTGANVNRVFICYSLLNTSSARKKRSHADRLNQPSTINQANLMTINLLLPKWLARKFARPRPRAGTRSHLKVRQVLPTLPKSKPGSVRFQDDNRPPGYRIQWHH